MSSNRRKSSSEKPSRFKKLLGWTVLLALVFSAGLITGERLVREKSFKPLVSVSSRAEAQPPGSEDSEPQQEQPQEQPAEETEYSFFDNLTDGTQPIIKRRDAPSRTRTGEKSEEKKKPAVEETQPPKADADETAEAESGESLPAKYTLQVAAHPDMESAKKHMARLRKMGLDPHVISAAIPDKGKFYRVRLGKFQSMKEARNFQADLKRKNSLNTFVSPL
ncbi:MAG: SPOR domain-containing protein [Myxococcota bacterium]